MTMNTPHHPTNAKTEKKPGFFERIIDRKLANQDRSPKAVEHRRFVAGVVVGALAVGGAVWGSNELFPQEKGSVTVTVEAGDTLRSVVCEGQAEVAKVVRSVEADDPACVAGAAALSGDLIRQTGADVVHPGDTIDVTVGRSGLGLQETRASLSNKS